MNIYILLIILVFVFIFSYLVTGFIRNYSLKNRVIDIPNDRSSHTNPTPRGGGLSITMSVLLGICISYLLELLDTNIALALLIGGFIVAVIGWIDDHINIPASVRVIGYAVAAGCAVYFLDLQSIRFGNHEIAISFTGNILLVLGIVWLTNLYNFMDGTDGLAAVEAVCISLFAGCIYWMLGDTGLALISFILMISCCGFLCWNWAPAKIFMGDVGSCFLGFCFAVLALAGEKENTILFPVWFILMSVFIVDATYTLIKRIIKREKWYSAHKSHAYQELVASGTSHSRLAIYVLLINIFMLWPFAFAAYTFREISHLIIMVVVILLSFIWLYCLYYSQKVNT